MLGKTIPRPSQFAYSKYLLSFWQYIYSNTFFEANYRMKGGLTSSLKLRKQVFIKYMPSTWTCTWHVSLGEDRACRRAASSGLMRDVRVPRFQSFFILQRKAEVIDTGCSLKQLGRPFLSLPSCSRRWLPFQQSANLSLCSDRAGRMPSSLA